ncbi:MAG: 50S ribosomal protein L29 [Gammaproteobacteria bacterium RIFCSPHIGHO2_12_FULL_43_28]|nr:MAG: 50S ribosomal protein L29 [Gammaproteobacteria bacterium RIFCSPHIGHO2_12_FULL_43_28]
MKAVDLKAKSIEELKQELLSLMREQFNLRMQRGAGQAPKGHLFSQVRKNIARIKTILNEKGSRV